MRRLLNKCKCSITLTVNKHRDYYMTVEQYIKDKIERMEMEEDDIPKNILEEMIKINTFIELQVYPHTPIGFYTVYGVDLEDVIQRALLDF